MLGKNSESRSMASQFRRDYLLVSIIPLLMLFILVVFGTIMTRDYLAHLIVEATHDLNTDAEKSLQKLGEKIIQGKSRDVAKQMEIYFRTHSEMSIMEMRRDPLFMEMALQKVGETGYTAITETKALLFRVHPNPKLVDQDMRPLAATMPSWWKIVESAISGDEAAGYYDWVEPDGTIRKKFMSVTPVEVPLNGNTMMVSATTYIDEFSAPVIDMKKKADRITENYQAYAARQAIVFGLIAAGLILLTFSGTYFLGRRAARRYMLPIAHLAQWAQSFGEGQLDLNCDALVIRRTDEIGTLAQAFSHMSSQLKTAFGNLERHVAELKQAQAALERSEAHFKELYEESKRVQEVYRSLIASSADPIAIYDLNGHPKYISPMFTNTFGWTLEELHGKPIPFVPDEERKGTMAMIEDILERGRLCQGFETRRLTKDGRVIDVSISASRYDDHEGKPAGLLVILRDISEKKRLEAQLQHVERMEAIGTLAGGIAHDFNNLLMTIQGSISLLRYGMSPAHPHYNHFVEMEKQVARGARLTGQLLGYARKGKYEVKPLRLNDILMESAEAFARMRKDISVKQDLASDLLPIEADGDQINQVLMNIFINAADAMADGGHLYLTTRNISSDEMVKSTYDPKLGQYVMLEIRDTGIGMDQKTKERIFDPFFTTKEMGRGTGLGLASVYGIVKGHGGYIDVASQPGQGATFTIYLPASGKPIEGTLAEPKLAASGQGTILIIDDEQLVLEVVTKMLGLLGYTVYAAADGSTALEIFKAHQAQIDLVILDMIMPEISGSLVYDRLREIKPVVTVMLSSGYSMDSRAREMLDRGCDGFIQKPYTIEQLAEKIKQIMCCDT
jgi:PAS domain S-box-containing protein